MLGDMPFPFFFHGVAPNRGAIFQFAEFCGAVRCGADCNI